MEYLKIEEYLKEIGFSSTEIKVYITLLRLGKSKAGSISKESELNRATVYECLKRLAEKGMINSVVGDNEQTFECVDPERLNKFIEEKRDYISRLVPELKKIYKEPKEKHSVLLFHGNNGVKTVFQNILREAKEVCVMDSEGQLLSKMPEYATYFIRQLDKKKIIVKYLVRKEGHRRKGSKYTEVRFIEKKTDSVAVYNVYNDKVAIFIWTDPPEVVLIKNIKVADSLRDYFNIIWEMSEKAKK